jgi:chitodextrinase
VKKYFVSLMVLLISVQFVALVKVNAYTGGLLNGKTLTLATDYNGTSTSTTALLTDNNETTGLNIAASGPGADVVYYKFASPVTIDRIRFNKVGIQESHVKFYKSDNSLITNRNYFTNALDESIAPIEQVSGVSWENIDGTVHAFNEFDVFGAVTVDTTPPANVTGLVASEITRTSFTVNWVNPSSDFAKARIFKDGVQIAETTNTSYSVTGLNSSITYVIKVTALDAAGNQNTGSTINVKTLDPPDITPPQPPVLTAAAESTRITLDWTAPSAPDVAGYNVYQGAVKLNTSLVTERTYVVSGLDEGTPYKFKVTAVDTVGNESQYSNEVITTTLDTTPPAAPTGLIATAGDMTVSLNWVQSSSSDAEGYEVYRGDVLQNTVLIKGNTYSQSDLVNGTAYQYYVRAVDLSGNRSPVSNKVTVTPKLAPLDVELTPNGTSIIVKISYGTPPYSIDWGIGSVTGIVDQAYFLTGLTKSTDYTVTVTSATNEVITKTVNTGTKITPLPSKMPDSTSLFQMMVNSFGRAGTLAMIVIGGAVSLGVIILLALWVWRLTKKWLAASK